ncbi:hypothetical protein LEP1GSC060_1956 [Leptospira weilii serovar Ranarum str. ICFT]|uniref:Uncharacterized protein n=1 Tax=Leptospira weilii serovar Ranarum str. ICFT TaxID=1218598 RepID=N1WAC9_9LEPT|nr:hypothetical protein LEP1GSC060_1956 [Leptospira weilii serovar Ranarum str. ICFT]
MKRLKVFIYVLCIFTSYLLLYSESKEVEYEVKKDVGEIVRGIYEIAPGVYEIGGSRSRQDHLDRLKVLKKEILPNTLEFRDAYLTGDLDKFFSYFSEDSYRPLIENYNGYLEKEGKPLIKTTKELFSVWKQDILDCRAKALVYDLCDFWKDRNSAIKNRVKILIGTYETGKFKNNIAAFVVAFVELDNNNPEHPYSQEFAFVKVKGKFKVFDNRRENELCVFCYYQSGEESVRAIFNSIKQANEPK